MPWAQSVAKRSVVLSHRDNVLEEKIMIQRNRLAMLSRKDKALVVVVVEKKNVPKETPVVLSRKDNVLVEKNYADVFCPIGTMQFARIKKIIE